jgi:uncharacterized RDD family membrane protein YckC
MNRRPSYTLAGRLERVLAYLIDLFILFFVSRIVVGILGETGIALLLGFLSNFAYFVHFTASRWQASPGQRVVGIYVVHTDGTSLSLRDSAERFLAYILPGLPFYSSALTPEMAVQISMMLTSVWFLPILLTEQRMGMHDFICRTRVVSGRLQ